MRAMCEVWLKDWNRDKDWMLMSHLNKTVDQLAVASSVFGIGMRMC